jgi:hypothetical protein
MHTKTKTLNFKQVKELRKLYPFQLNRSQIDEIVVQLPSGGSQSDILGLALSLDPTSPNLSEIELFCRYQIKLVQEMALETQREYAIAPNNQRTYYQGQLLAAELTRCLEGEDPELYFAHQVSLAKDMYLTWKVSVSKELFSLQLTGYNETVSLQQHINANDPIAGVLTKLSTL